MQKNRHSAKNIHMHPLYSFIVKRTFTIFTMLFVLGLLLFGLIALAPGNIVDNYVIQQIFSSEGVGSEEQFSEEAIAAAKARLGLDKPFYVQYVRWLKQVFIDRDLGRSFISRAPILFLVQQRMINTLVLNTLSLIVLTVLSFSISIVLSAFSTSKYDFFIAFTAILLSSIPGILILTLLQLFAASTGLFPITGYPPFSFVEAPLQFIFSYSYHIFIPLLGSFLIGIGSTLRMVRATMLDQLGKPFIRVLRSRGISEKRILFHHAFMNTVNPYITNSATLLASLFSGSLILEIIFSYPGMGSLMFEAVRQEDIHLVVTNILFISTLILIGILISDIVLAIIDPRIRYTKDT